MRVSDSVAVLFDLDGVLTDTAAVHERAWARVFTDFFASQPAERDTAPYTDADYFTYIDGKPRLEGVRAVLDSRSIVLPEGEANDSTDAATVYGLGNRKNALFLQLLETEGVQAFPGSTALVDRLTERGLPIAVVSSSRNANAVLVAADLASKFSTVVDGELAATIGLAGKPAPDTFLHAAAELGAEPHRTIVIEDASSGVRAAHAGGFWVVGVDRGSGHSALLDDGADIVITDLAELLEQC
ncbi:HAD family hydrolase [Antrihabitans spumae]|uniref:Beta-phosphoglucomutase n=1 Tax=Antrihabitans spumae TaxID=3373370 RepID=A0ABW7KNB8_9NOCA